MYHATVMQRPVEEEQLDDEKGIKGISANASVRRERITNGPGGASNTYNSHPHPHPLPHLSTPQPEFHPAPYSPTSNGTLPRPQFNNSYHPPTPAALPMPPRAPSSTLGVSSYPAEYQREKPTSNYYDPTSDSSERRPVEPVAWNEGQTQTSQV